MLPVSVYLKFGHRQLVAGSAPQTPYAESFKPEVNQYELFQK
jgi:hypothetical protein